MDKQRQDNQHEPIFNSSVPIQDIALKTYQEQWMIESSVLAARHDDDEENILDITHMRVWFVWLLSKLSTPYGAFNVKIFLFIYKHLFADGFII